MGLTAFNRLRREQAALAAKKAEEAKVEVKPTVKPVEPTAPVQETPAPEVKEEPVTQAAPKTHAVGKKTSK